MISGKEISYGDIEQLYQRIKFDKATIAVYGVVGFIVFVITCFRIIKVYQKENDKGMDYKSFIEILKPLIPFYIVLALLPGMVSILEKGISILMDSFGTFDSLDIGSNDLEEYQKESYKEFLTTQSENAWWKFNFTDLFDHGRQYVWFGLIKQWNRYLFTMALSVYYMWLLLLEVFAPLGMIGLIFKELKGYSDTWIKNFLACKLFLAGIFVANLLSLGLYKLYRDVGDYPLIVQIIFLVIFRGYLYKQALNISKSII